MRYAGLRENVAVEARQRVGPDTIVEHPPAADPSIDNTQADTGCSEAAGQDVRPAPVLALG